MCENKDTENTLENDASWYGNLNSVAYKSEVLYKSL